MSIQLRTIGNGVQKFQAALKKIERERLREIGKSIRPPLRDAVKFGRALVRVLFGGRGKRIKRAFVTQIRIRPDNVVARLGYTKPKGKGGSRRFWFLGRFYEKGVNITSDKHLWIPIGENRARGGDPVVSARQFFSDFQGRSVVKTSQRGNLIAFRRDGSEIVPMFVLKKSVSLKARPTVTPTVRRHLPKIQGAAGTRLREYFK